MASGLPLVERAILDGATADAAERLRTRWSSLGCKEVEQLMDGNFIVNDEVLATLRQAWDCAVRLDCQLGEAARRLSSSRDSDLGLRIL